MCLLLRFPFDMNNTIRGRGYLPFFCVCVCVCVIEESDGFRASLSSCPLISLTQTLSFCPRSPPYTHTKSMNTHSADLYVALSCWVLFVTCSDLHSSAILWRGALFLFGHHAARSCLPPSLSLPTFSCICFNCKNQPHTSVEDKTNLCIDDVKNVPGLIIFMGRCVLIISEHVSQSIKWEGCLILYLSVVLLIGWPDSSWRCWHNIFQQRNTNTELTQQNNSEGLCKCDCFCCCCFFF